MDPVYFQDQNEKTKFIEGPKPKNEKTKKLKFNYISSSSSHIFFFITIIVFINFITIIKQTQKFIISKSKNPSTQNNNILNPTPSIIPSCDNFSSHKQQNQIKPIYPLFNVQPNFTHFKIV